VKLELGRDTYSRSARLMPALLVFLPLGLVAGAWATTAADSKAIGGLVTLAASFGLASLLAQIGRDAGRERQDQLYALWGGKPTTVMLRHRTGAFNRHTLARYHAKLSALVPELRLPSVEQEQADPGAADEVYEACIDYLLAHTRDQSKFRLIFEENVNYGFRRNMWGMKPAAILINLAALAFTGALFLSRSAGQRSPDGASVAAFAVTALMLSWWLVRIRPDWVRLAADAYARQLIAASDEIDPSPPPTRSVITR
jgi:hypothetical protein